MATKIGYLSKFRNFPSSYRKFSSNQVIYNKPQATTTPRTPKATPNVGNVPGLSSAVVEYGSSPVGPGASKDSNYKNPEYFCYHQGSYFEAEIEMLQYRCPQPSSKK